MQRRVHTTVDLGAMLNIEDDKFDVQVPAGTPAVYLGIHPTVDGWHYCEVSIEGRTYFLPCRTDQFTPDAEVRA